METYISILRGINLSGHRIIKMDDLKLLFSNFGFINIRTYIQSGNVVFQFKKENTKILDNTIKEAIKEQFGFDVPVITLTIEELKKTTNSNPFLTETTKDNSFFHVTFLAEKPQIEDCTNLMNGNYLPDEFRIVDKAVYLYCPNNYSSSKLTNGFLESKLKVTATTRNWKTTRELINISDRISNL